jgi:hypothetical protein
VFGRDFSPTWLSLTFGFGVGQSLFGYEFW